MTKKIYKLVMCVLVVCLFANYTFAQGTGTKTVKKKTNYPIFTLSPVGGAIFPMSELGNSFKAGFNVGLDGGLRLNKELGLYTKFGYYSLSSNTAGVPKSSYIEMSVGPRYYFSKPNLKSSFFLEAGVGAYIFSQDAFVTSGVNVEKISNTNIGLNVGPGVTLQLSKAVDIIIKSKYHMVFNEGGSRAFLTALGGLEFKF